MRGFAQRLEPLAKKLAADLATLLSERVDAMVLQIEHAFDVALSAAAGALADGGGDSVETSIVPVIAPPTVVRAVIAKPAAAKPAPAPAPKVPGRVVCRKCGYVGGNARGCGTAHETIIADAIAGLEDDAPKRDRRDAIKASATKRSGDLPAPRSSFDVDHETGEVRELDFGGGE